MHSNRLAPSRDIALAFAHYSRVRHLLSGGHHFFRDSEQSRKYLRGFGPSLANPGSAPSDHVGNAGIWRKVFAAGPHMVALLNQNSSASGYVGPSLSVNPRFGTCVPKKRTLRPYGDTDMARHFPTFIPPTSLSLSNVFTAISMTLLNGDVCRVGEWVLFSLSTNNTEAPVLGRIHEIVVDMARSQQYPRPDAILLQQADVGEPVEHYRMPSVSVSNNWVVVNIVVSDPNDID